MTTPTYPLPPDQIQSFTEINESRIDMAMQKNADIAAMKKATTQAQMTELAKQNIVKFLSQK